MAVLVSSVLYIRKMGIRLLLVLVCWSSLVQAQTIRVKGKVVEEHGQPVSNAIVVNLRTKSGAYGSPDGSFVIECNKTDTLSITCLGYFSRRVCFKDSSEKMVYYPKLFLEERVYRYESLVVFAPRDLEDIQKDIRSLGYNENDYRLTGVDMLNSPVTFLYQALSKKENSRRVVAQMENDDRRRDLLKELFRIYVDYEIIELNTSEFDDFITYLNVDDTFLQSSSQYEFLVFVKERFKDYKIAMRNAGKLRNSDFDYDKE